MSADPGSMRAVLRSLVPWYARQGAAWRALEPLGRAFDKTLQASVDAVRMRYPSVCPPDALALLGRDRRLPRAPGESEASYRRRLLLWLDYWSHAGLPLGLLYAIQSYIYPGYSRVRMVTRDGWWYTLDEGASATMTPYEAMTLPCAAPAGFASSADRYVPALEASPRSAFWMHAAETPNFDYDSNSNPERAAAWWDFWIIIYPTSYEIQDVYDGPPGLVYDSNTCWGLKVPQSTVDTLRTLVRMFKRAGSQCRNIMFAPTLADFDPYAAVDAVGMPDGWWGQNVRNVGGVWTGTRRPDVRYVEV
jgi:hypothetical protein